MNRLVKSQEKFNTNNAWGFGGSISTLTTYQDGYAKRSGYNCYRHIKSQRFTLYFDAAGKEITKKEFDKPENGGTLKP